MIKPSELSTHSAPSAHLAQIEDHIDREIRQHAASGRHWPLSIRTTRSGWLFSEIEHVLAHYRAAGWIALTPGNGLMAVLSPAPASGETPTERRTGSMVLGRDDSADARAEGTAYHTGTAIAALVEAGLQPAGRATATATTLREMASIGDQLPITLADAHAGYDALSRIPTPAGQPAITTRRQTCAEIAVMIQAEMAGRAWPVGQPHRLGDVLAAVAERYAGAARQAAICETSKREALELAAGARPMAMSPDEAAVLGDGAPDPDAGHDPACPLEHLGPCTHSPLSGEPTPPQARNTMGGGPSMDEIIQGMHDKAARREPSE